MTHALEDIVAALKAARRAKGLSQRALSAKVGLTQAHISRFENGSVDIKLSSLIQLARALDLEVTLVPRKAVPAVQGLVRKFEAPASANANRVLPAYRLDEDESNA